MLIGKKKVVFVAMSGGVDSSVSALLLKHMGFDVVGVTMMLYKAKMKGEGRSCCTVYDISDAERVARKIKIPFYVMDMQDDFRKYVIENFISEYKNGRTPIPCVHCNNFIKFNIFFRKAQKLGADLIATGHYAVKKMYGGKVFIAKSKDIKKDQSYFLFGLTSEILEKVIFPVGGMTKERVRKIAEGYGLPTAKKRESQDICFTEGRDWRDVMKEMGIEEKEGKIIYKGKIVGKHPGYFFFTVGQRRGLGVRVGKPVYITGIIPEENIVVIGEEEELMKERFYVKDVIFANENVKNKLIENGKIECIVKVRYSHQGTYSLIRPADEEAKCVEVLLNEKYGPIVPGQACVFYVEDIVIGGGFISEVAPKYEHARLPLSASTM